jgi:pyruvate dehydrogenase E2 component (dihydrolipoamide acetyltransferase)
MARVVEMPKLSPTMEEGQIASWHVKEGDSVEVDDLLAEVETDKATMEFRSFDKGTVLKILAPEGSVVRLGDPVAILGKEGEDVSELVAQAGGGNKAPTKQDEAAEAPEEEEEEEPEAEEEQEEEPEAEEEQEEEPEEKPAPKKAAPSPSRGAKADKPKEPGGRVKASPYVRKLARERSLDLAEVVGSGPGGRIVARDLEGVTPSKEEPKAASKAKAPQKEAAPKEAPKKQPAAKVPPAPPSRPQAPARDDAESEARPLSMMRKTIARRLTESKQTVPHFYLTIDVDAGPLAALRERLNADLATAPAPQKVSFNDLVIKAAAIAITRSPSVNAQFTPEALVFHRRVDISVAVAVEDGLVTPVVRRADQKNVLAISAEVRDLAARARNKKLSPEEMTGGTFSISNLGMYGIDAFAAVINPPEGAILAVGSVRAEPVIEGDRVVPGKRMAMTLSCDHRVVDGAIGAAFLAELRKVLENPTQILAF